MNSAEPLGIPRDFRRSAGKESRAGSESGLSRTAASSRSVYEIAKRILDIILSIVALALLSPLMLIIAILVRLDSRGPALFRQVRIGINCRRVERRRNGRPGSSDRRQQNLFGKPFVIYKFRSMHADARERFPELYTYTYSEEERHTLPIKILVAKKDASGGENYEESDPRVTRLGRWLRRTSFDELPNFWSVLKGDMHLVGPRPDITENIRYYSDLHKHILDVKPGITGLAQVNGRGKLSFVKTNEYDIEYVSRRSLLLDLKILFKTILVSIKRDGAF
jgi:lipopolysaccharide/colanic/teichoic acid biosynthesis glycosyltransferase